MSAIYDRLIHLNESVIALEKAAELPAKKMQEVQAKLQDSKKRPGKTPPPDLFSMTSPAANKNAVGPVAYDPALAARKLDLAIEKVEKVLREG